MNKDSKLIIKNGTILSIAPYLPQALNILLLPIMTKYLTSVDFGISGTINAYSSAISAFMLLGLNVVLNNSFYKYPLRYKWIWRQIYGFLKLWMIVYAIIQATILYFFIPTEAQDKKWIIIILANFSTVFFGPTGSIGSCYYLNSKKVIPVVWRSVAASLITILVDFTLIVYFRLGYLGWYVGTFAGTFFTNASYWYFVNFKIKIRPIYKIRWNFIKKSLSVGLPTVPHYYSNYLLESAGRIVLDQNHVNQGEIGKISISQSFCSVINGFMQSANQAISPFIMESIAKNNEHRFKSIAIAYISVAFALLFMGAVWSKELFYILLSDASLKNTYTYFILYVMALCYKPLYCVSSYYYFYYENTKQLLLITFASGVIALIIYIILIPFWGAWGFMIGHYIACLYFGYAGYFYSTYKQHDKIHIPILFYFILQILLTILAYVVVEYIFIKAALTVVIIIVLFLNRKKILALIKK